jgi:hypothetical protein
MKHLSDISALVRTLQCSKKFHSLVIESPPGWAKSTTVSRILDEQGTPYKTIGSYTTPLSFYKTLCEFSDSILVFDDCVGIFGDSVAMSLLKAAAWEGVGTHGSRVVRWQSSSEKVKVPSSEFRGKLILITNQMPSGSDSAAFISRALYVSFQFNDDEVYAMLRIASQSKLHFDDTELSARVTEKLIELSRLRGVARLNLRSLQVMYEVAKCNPESWESLILTLMPTEKPRELVLDLMRRESSVEEQAKEFARKTGLSRRTFFNYRSELAGA